MSKATRQSQALLAAIGGCLFEINRKLPPTPEYRESSMLLGRTYQQILGILERWPDTGDKSKNKQWILRAVEDWRRGLNQEHPALPLVMVTVCDKCYTDLLTVIKDKHKLALLEPLAGGLLELQLMFGQDGEQFDAYAESDRLMRGLYARIEWRG